MSRAVGHQVWAIAEGYFPGQSARSDHALDSHETACILNPSGEDAAVSMMLFFADREPCGPYRSTKIGARRTLHLRFNDLTDPEPVPRDTSYASVIESTVPIIVQHNRLVSRNPNIALLSIVAFAA